MAKNDVWEGVFSAKWEKGRGSVDARGRTLAAFVVGVLGAVILGMFLTHAWVTTALIESARAGESDAEDVCRRE